MHITKLPSEQWQAYKDLRLLALKSDPEAFGSSYEEELGLSEQNWRNRINAMWFAVIDDQVAGLIGLLPKEGLASKHIGIIVSLWIKPEFRGRGLAKDLLKTVQDNAKSLGFRKLSLHVTTNQAAAIKLYKEMGFEYIGFLKENLFKNGYYLDEYLMEWHCR